MAEVKVIKANKENIVRRGMVIEQLRVAAYCRVSTDTEDQINSYKSQVQYYTDLIASKPEWQMAGIYSDAAITGTKVDKREGFRNMIADCTSGKIDLVITKSISRFARNTLDTLKYVRLLKDKGVAVIFEDENINTMAMEGELLLTVLSSVAQQEVENISANVKKGLQIKMSRGEMVGFNGCLGYDYHPENKSITVNEREAAIVKRIFERYIQGVGCKFIADELREMGALKKDGTSEWTECHIRGILQNVKYQGDLLMGSTYTTDPISKRRVLNRGEQDMYYMRDHHQPIVSRELFDEAQKVRISRRQKQRRKDDRVPLSFKHYPFSGMIKCGYCGTTFTRKTVHGNYEQYKRYIWQCTNYIKNGKRSCPKCKAIREEILEGAFVDAYNLLCQDEKKRKLLTTALDVTFELMESIAPSDELDRLKEKLEKEKERKQKIIDLLISERIGEEAYENRIAITEGKITNLKNKIDRFELRQSEISTRTRSLRELKRKIDNGEMLTGFDVATYEALVKYIIVGGENEYGEDDPHKIIFVINNGEKLIATGKDYKPQKSRDAALRFQKQRMDDAFVEILSFSFYADHVDFGKSGDGLKKNLLNSTRVSMVIPVITDAADGTDKVPAASKN